MKKLTFSGSSDDNFGWDINGKGGDEIGCYDKPAAVKLTDADGSGLYVFGQYAPMNLAACWMVGVSQLDEDKPLPGWPMAYSIDDSGYSVVLTVEVPDSVTITPVDRSA